MQRQVAGGALSHMADSQAKDQPREARGACGRNLIEQVLGRLLCHSGQRYQGCLGKSEDIGEPRDQPVIYQLLSKLVAQALDI
nr:hypothetical protein NCPCFENI_01268 [Cupriavidus sp.]